MRRQSIPSSSIDSCAALRLTVPCVACGHTKRPRSRRLANRHNPSPLHQRIFTRSPARPLKTKSCPENGFGELCLHESSQSVESLAHVGGTRCQPHLDPGRKRDHRPERAAMSSLNITRSTGPRTRSRWPLANSTSMCAGSFSAVLGGAARSVGITVGVETFTGSRAPRLGGPSVNSPCRHSRRQTDRRFAFTPCRCATSGTEAP